MLSKNLLAQISIGHFGDPDTKSGFGPFSGLFQTADIGGVGNKFSDLMSKIIGIMTIAGGLWFLIQFVVGAFKWLTSGGDKNNVESAKEHLTHAVIGLAVLVAAYVIAGLIGAIFGLDILNPQKIIPLLGVT